MKNKNLHNGFLALACGLLLGAASCSKMDNSYYRYIKSGERLYTAKADALQAFSGKNRTELTWVLLSDPSVTGCKITWIRPDSTPDSTEVTVNKTSGADSVQAIINNLPEGHYDFQVASHDDLGHSSLKSSLGVDVYGDTYRSQLLNRLPQSFILSNSMLTSTWYTPDTINITTEVRYIDSLGEVRTVYLSPDSSKLAFPGGWKLGTEIYFQSSYKPVSSAIDTFMVSHADSMAEVDITNGGIAFSAQRENTETGQVSLNLVDNDINTKFLLFDFYGVWAQLEFNAPELVSAYTLTSGEDSPDRDPYKWELLGSNNGAQWTVLDNEDGQIFTSRHQTIRYNFDNTIRYKYYRLNIISVAGGNGGLFQMAEWRVITRF